MLLAPQNICVFAASSLGDRPEFRDAAESLGTLLAERGCRLIYGGASVGLMGVLADATLQAGGELVGVLPQCLVDLEVAHHGLTELHVVRSMHERKALMADLSDAVLALPGGLGTLEELFEILTWTQLGIQTKPSGVLNLAGFFDHFFAMIDRAVEEGFVSTASRQMILCETDPGRLLDRLASHELPSVEVLLDRSDLR
ncbi:MAG: TIGR00730 family Rossman fold protein [Planctomycetota bacterium]